MMKQTTNKRKITTLNRGIATILLLSQLLTSCGGFKETLVAPSRPSSEPIHIVYDESIYEEFIEANDSSKRFENKASCEPFALHITTIEGTRITFTHTSEAGLQATYQPKINRKQGIKKQALSVQVYPLIPTTNGTPKSFSQLTAAEAMLLAREGKWEVSADGALRYLGMRGRGGMEAPLVPQVLDLASNFIPLASKIFRSEHKVCFGVDPECFDLVNTAQDAVEVCIARGERALKGTIDHAESSANRVVVNCGNQARLVVEKTGEEARVTIDHASEKVLASIDLMSEQMGIRIEQIEQSTTNVVHAAEGSTAASTLSDPLGRGIHIHMIVEQDNLRHIKQLLQGNYVGEKAWAKLGIVIDERGLPPISQKLLNQAKDLHDRGEQPLLVLDIGMSIEALEAKCAAQKLTVLGSNAEKLRAEACYKAPGEGMRWLLLPGSGHGVLPGSRNLDYAEQVQHMHTCYPGYEVGGARELVTLAMLKYLQDGTVLFGDNPTTWAWCKELYQTGDWKDRIVTLGNRSSSASGGLFVPNDICPHEHYSQFGLFCVCVQIR